MVLEEKSTAGTHIAQTPSRATTIRIVWYSQGHRHTRQQKGLPTGSPPGCQGHPEAEGLPFKRRHWNDRVHSVPASLLDSRHPKKLREALSPGLKGREKAELWGSGRGRPRKPHCGVASRPAGLHQRSPTKVIRVVGNACKSCI